MYRTARSISFLVVWTLCAVFTGNLHAEWTHATAHGFAPTAGDDAPELATDVHNIHTKWSTPIHTGIGKSGSGTVLSVLEAGFEPTFGCNAAPVVADGLLLVSWSRATGDISARPDSPTDRYFRNVEQNRLFKDTYLRIDADWVTAALDIHTGDVKWQTAEASASMNFITSKRGHNGINGAAGNGVYVTVSILGKVFAYDIPSGKRLWETTIPGWHENALAAKNTALENRTIPGIQDGIFGMKRAGAVIAGNVAVVPDFQEGLIGLSLEDGAQIWRKENALHNQATPWRWEDDGNTWIISHASRGRDAHMVHLIDPATGKAAWSHPTGYNPGQLTAGEGYILLNANANRRNPALWTAYRITAGGLEEHWQLPDDDRFRYPIRPDRGAERRAVIRDGIVYAALGQPNNARFVNAIDLASGNVLHREEETIHSNAGLPVILGDKMYWQTDSSHSGPSGVIVYQLLGEGRFERLGSLTYDSLGIGLVIDYEHPIEYPYAEGMLFLRGKENIAAVSLRMPADGMAELELENLWGGLGRPLQGRVFAGRNGNIIAGRLESPPRFSELGVIGTTGWRTDSWGVLEFPDGSPLGAEQDKTTHMTIGPITWQVEMQMQQAQDGIWEGIWVRQFPGWKETLMIEGEIHADSRGGYKRRGWPTPWLAHQNQPFTYFDELGEGEQRIVLQMNNIIPNQDGLHNLTLCIDHSGESIIGAVGGAFGFNQSYHEFEAVDFEIDETGIRGTGRLVLNSDRWVPGDYKNEGSLLGHMELDVQYHTPDNDGIFPVTGTWKVEWGLQDSRQGAVRGVIK